MHNLLLPSQIRLHLTREDVDFALVHVGVQSQFARVHMYLQRLHVYLWRVHCTYAGCMCTYAGCTVLMQGARVLTEAQPQPDFLAGLTTFLHAMAQALGELYVMTSS